jgi:hypothetical protein
MRTGFLTILIAATTFAVLPVAKTAAKEKTSPTNCSLSAEDYEVFSAVLSDLGQPEDTEESWSGKDILLSDVTAQQEFKDKQWGRWGFHSKSKATPTKETQADASTKAEDHCQVEPKLQASLSYQMISNILTRFSKNTGGVGMPSTKHIQRPLAFGTFRARVTTQLTMRPCSISDTIVEIFAEQDIYIF